MSKLDELLSNIHWMVHYLVDGDHIDNDEEKRLLDVHKNAAAELAALQAALTAAWALVESWRSDPALWLATDKMNCASQLEAALRGGEVKK